MSKTAKRMKAMWALKAAKAAAAFELLLDESMFGKLAEDATLPLFLFFGHDGTLITKRHGTKLIATTPAQYHGWKCAGLTMKPATA